MKHVQNFEFTEFRSIGYEIRDHETFILYTTVALQAHLQKLRLVVFKTS